MPNKQTSKPQSPPCSIPAKTSYHETISEKLEVAYNSLKHRFQGMDSELNFLTQYLEGILDNVSQGILFVDVTGIVTTYNHAAETILGVPSQKVLYHEFWSNFSDEYLGFSMKESLETLSYPGTVFTKIDIKNGEPKEIEVEASFIQKHSQKESTPMQGIILLVRDVTEYRRLEVIAQRKNRMNELGEMASMVAHEIRNPLGGIKGFASLLERDLAEKPDLQKMATYIIQGTDNLNSIVTRVLNYSRPLQGEIEPEDLIPIVEKIHEHVLNDKDRAQNVEVILECREKSLIVPIDAQAIRASLLNLIRNACQAMPDGGQVRVSVEKDDTHVTIQIADNGVGIPPENLKKIFSPFFTTKPDGNGFGLSEVHKIIQGHDGTIEVDSEVGKGTTFTIKLPLKRKG